MEELTVPLAPEATNYTKKNRVCDESKVKTNDSLPPKRWQVKRFPFTFNQM